MCDSSHEAAKVIKTPNRRKPVSKSARRAEEKNAEAPIAEDSIAVGSIVVAAPIAEVPTISEIMVSSSGNRPLQGTRLFVRIAIKRSLGESMIRQPVTPAALQPSPIAMVRHCFPQA